jgi:hypothetical protein
VESDIIGVQDSTGAKWYKIPFTKIKAWVRDIIAIDTAYLNNKTQNLSDSGKGGEALLEDGAVTSQKIRDATIAVNDFSQATKDYISAGGSGSIINQPDDTDLETKPGSVIGLKDGGYLGYYYVRNEADLNALIAAATPGRWLFAKGITLGGGKPLPLGVTLVYGGGKFILGDNNISGNDTKIECGLNQMFEINGTGRLTGTWDVDIAHAEWFGATADGTTNDDTEIQHALDTFDNVELGNKTYGVASILIKPFKRLAGKGKKTILKSVATAANLIDYESECYFSTIENFQIEGGFETNYQIRMPDADNGSLVEFDVKNAIRNVRCDNSAAGGVYIGQNNRECRLHNIQVYWATGKGFVVAGTDNSIMDIVTGASGSDGVQLTSSAFNNRLVNIKSFTSGKTGTGSGMVISGDYNNIQCLDLQQNTKDGMFITGSYNLITLQSDSNGENNTSDTADIAAIKFSGEAQFNFIQAVFTNFRLNGFENYHIRINTPLTVYGNRVIAQTHDVYSGQSDPDTHRAYLDTQAQKSFLNEFVFNNRLLPNQPYTIDDTYIYSTLDKGSTDVTYDVTDQIATITINEYASVVLNDGPNIRFEIPFTDLELTDIGMAVRMLCSSDKDTFGPTFTLFVTSTTSGITQISGGKESWNFRGTRATLEHTFDFSEIPDPYGEITKIELAVYGAKTSSSNTGTTIVKFEDIQHNYI